MEQTASINGSGNILIQAVGSTVTVGAAHLWLTPRHRQRRRAEASEPSDSDLLPLDPQGDAIPFLGRDTEM